MIVCSCNIFSDGDVKACLGSGPGCPCTPAQVYRCLGCSPQCGRCATTIRSLLSDQPTRQEQAATTCCGQNRCSAPVKFIPSPPPPLVTEKRTAQSWKRRRDIHPPHAEKPALAR